MSLLFTDSFSTYTTQILRKWTTGGAGTIGTTSTVVRRTGAPYYFIANGNADVVTKTLPSSDDVVIVGAAMRPNAIPSVNHILIGVQEGATVHDRLVVEATTGNALVYRGASATLLQTSTLPLFYGAEQWVYVCMKVVVADAGGSIIVWRNGVEIINFTGDTRNAGTTGLINTVALGGTNSATNTAFCDVVICDGNGSVNNGLFPDARVDALRPTAEGNTIAFTPSTGTDNSANVDDATPDDDTTYNSSASAGDKDTFVTGDMPATPTSIMGVVVQTQARKDDAGAVTLRHVIRSDGVDYESADLTLGDTYGWHGSVWETDPDTSAAWTESGVNAMETGYKRQA